MTRVEEFEKVTNKYIIDMINENEGTFEERQTKIANAYLCDIARSLAVIADALNKEVSNESD